MSSRSSSAATDFNPKITASPEVKSISSKRLYRSVLECVRKLEQGHQHRRNLISLFQPEQVKLRHRLRESCERLMFTYPNEYGKKAEELLWRKVYYDVIHAVKNGRKFQSNAPGALQQRHLVPHYQQFLYSAVGYYQYLLLKMQSRVRPGLVDMDCSLASRPLRDGARHRLDKSNKDAEEKELEKWVTNTSYRLLLCLGDLSRYQMEFGSLSSRAKRFYQLALLAQPNTGMPHNQIATLAGHHTWWGLTAAYHYCCSLHAEHSFEGADGNLQRLLDRNKKLFYQLPTDALSEVITTQKYKKEHTRIFITSYLYLCDLLRPKTYATDVEITGLCKRLIDSLPVCLSNIKKRNDGTGQNEEGGKQDQQSFNPHLNYRSFKPRYQKDSKKNAKKAVEVDFPSLPSLNKITKSNERFKQSQQQQYLNEEVVFQICVLCLVNVHDLQSCRSNRSSAAIAFALAFFSHLLGYAVQIAKSEEIQAKKTSILKSLAEEESEKLVADKKQKEVVEGGDNTAPSTAVKKSKVRGHHHIRRRRRMSGEDEGDLSEGEDAMAAGDADSDSDTNSERSSFTDDSSESRDQLSQEELSNDEDEDDDVIKKPIPPPDQDEVKLSVDSLQDMSSKMFQPSTRRQITLAPSFLQHLSSPVSNKSSNDNSDSDQDSVTQAAKLKDEIRKKETLEKYNQKKTASLKRFDMIRHRHFLMASIKLLCDWLASNLNIVSACSKSSRALWCRLVCFINLMPTERMLLESDECDGSAIQQLNEILQAVEPTNKAATPQVKVQDDDTLQGKDDSSTKENGVKAKMEADVKILRNKVNQLSVAPVNDKKRWRQRIPLPEDMLLFRMNAVKDANNQSQIDVNSPKKEMSDYLQCVIRVCRLRDFCRTLCTTTDVEVETVGDDECKGNEVFSAPDEENVDPQMGLEAVEAMRKARLMKDMAASRLRTEVAALESSLQKSKEASLCLYLIPDVTSLCYELPHIRRLVASERFFVIIPTTVIDGLDNLKKEVQGARDAIRFLEHELKKKSRFIRAQGAEELVKIEGEPSKLRRQDINAWRFYRMLECCRYFIKHESKKAGVQEAESKGLVSILRQQESGNSSPVMKAALKSAKTMGIQINNAVQFEKSWSQQTS